MSFVLSAITVLASITASSNSHHQVHGVDLDPRIVNGAPISANEYPWMVSLRQEVLINGTWLTNSFCGGSILELEPIVVMTAAHCVDFLMYNATDDTIRIHAGNSSSYVMEFFLDINRTDPDESIPGDSFYTLQVFDLSPIYIHPLWNTSDIGSGHDIALIVFDMDYNSTLPADYPLPALPSQLDSGEPCCSVNESLTAIGYGLSSDGGISTDTLEATTLRFVDSLECAQRWWTTFGLLNYTVFYNNNFTLFEKEWDSGAGESILCVIGQNTDVCQGDSGGPLIRVNTANEAKIIGVASFVFNGCNSGDPSAYTSVGHYYDWIQETIDYAVFGPPSTTEEGTATTGTEAASTTRDDEGDHANRMQMGYVVSFILLISSVPLL